MSVTVGQRLPALLDLVDVGHVGHGAAGVEVGEDDPLVGAGEHVGRLGHEVHAAEHDVGGLVVVRREAGELERVAAGVGPLDDLVALVVVAEDQEPVAELGLGRGDPAVELVGGREGVAVRQRSLESQHRHSPEGYVAPLVAGGDSLVAHRGVVGHGTDMCAGIPGRLSQHHNARRSRRSACPLRARSGANRRSRAATMGECSRPVPSSIPDTPGSYQFKDARGPGALRRQGQEPAEPGRCRTSAPAWGSAPARWWPRPTRSSGSRSRNEVEALFLEFNLIKQAPAPLQHPATRTTSRTRTSRSPSTRSGRGRW